jgi:hypothetical protein
MLVAHCTGVMIGVAEPVTHSFITDSERASLSIVMITALSEGGADIPIAAFGDTVSPC